MAKIELIGVRPPKEKVADLHITLYNNGEVEVTFPMRSPDGLWMLEVARCMLMSSSQRPINPSGQGH